MESILNPVECMTTAPWEVTLQAAGFLGSPRYAPRDQYFLEFYYYNSTFNYDQAICFLVATPGKMAEHQ